LQKHYNSVLKNEGRGGVKRLVLESKRLEDVPHEIKDSFDEIKLTARDEAGYRKAVREYLVKNNPGVDSATVEFRALAGLLASYFEYNNGKLIADDYNFNVDHYNNCRLIAKYINATKLPQPFKDGLREYYSSTVIVRGNEKNAGDEMNWLNWIPSGGTVIYFTETKIASVKGTLVSGKNELPDLIAAVHPDFKGFSDEGRQRALEFIGKMNPYIHAETISEVIDGKKITKTTLKAEKGKPILIPLYKFIAE
jgi:hypothetical protein